MQPVHVVAAAIVDSDRVLITRRPAHVHQGGCWEFPGGKVEPGESATSALARELREEIDIDPSVLRPLIRVPWNYPEKSVLLDVYLVTEFRGHPRAMEGQAMEWVARSRLGEYTFPAANQPILRALELPRRYVVTPDMSCPIPGLVERIQTLMDAGNDLFYLRGTDTNSETYLEQASKAAQVIHARDGRALVRGLVHHDLVSEVGGVHLDSATLMSLRARTVSNDCLLAASCHSLEEVEHANRLCVDFIVVSPVNRTRSHPDATPIGWSGFRLLTDAAQCPVYALGGMSDSDLARAFEMGAQGIAALSEYWPNG